MDYPNKSGNDEEKIPEHTEIILCLCLQFSWGGVYLTCR